MPPGIVFCPLKEEECEPLFAQSCINAYNTAFNQGTSGFSGNYQQALNNYYDFIYSYVNNFFVLGTFGSREEYNSLSQSQPFIIHHLQDDTSIYLSLIHI